jgi:hypothetical protein
MKYTTTVTPNRDMQHFDSTFRLYLVIMHPTLHVDISMQGIAALGKNQPCILG